MKKILIVLTIIALTFVMAISAFAAETDNVIQPGDANLDGEINIKDVVLLAQYLAGWDVELGGDSHTIVIDEAVEPTCKTTGLTEGQHCSDCGLVLVKQEIIPTTDHDFDEIVFEPTTTSEGYTLCKCKVCEHEEKKDFVPVIYSTGFKIEVDDVNKTCVITGIGICKDTDIVIPKKIDEYTVIGIDMHAFSYHPSLTSVTIPDSVTSIGDSAFYNCICLTSAIISNGVTSIGFRAFYGCSMLESIIIPDSVTNIGDDAFNDTAYYNNASNWEDNVLYIGNHCIEAKLNISGSYYIKQGTKTITNWAFRGCRGLTSVTISDSVTSIGDSAFSYCDGLTAIEVYENNEYYCDIDGVLFSKDMKTLIQYPIGNEATTYSIPDGVMSIGDSAFSYCNNLTAIEVDDNNKYYCDIDGVLLTKDMKTLIQYPKGNKATSYAIPDSVTSIGKYAFQSCRNLISVTIPDSVENIGHFAFISCSSLSSVTIPGSITSIYKGTFWDCSNLISVTIPNSITSIAGNAFHNCRHLITVYYGGNAESWNTISVDVYNSSLTDAIRYYYSEVQPTEEGNYWHYVDGKPTPW